MKKNIITPNSLNNVGGVVENHSPVFIPSIVNSRSTLDIHITPDTGKRLAATTGSLILQFP
jgi:hypothetical protein